MPHGLITLLQDARRMDTTNSFTKNRLIKMIDRAFEFIALNNIGFK